MKLLNWKWRYFHRKLKGVDKMIADIEFKRFKSREVREEMRQVYDQKKSQLVALEERIKTEKNKKPNDKTKLADGDIARLEDDVVRMNVDIENTLKSVKALDLEIDGSPKCHEYPDGAQGMGDQIDALYELKAMIKSYMKSL